MELMQLEMFVAVAEEGSVHKAADKVCRTQPAVSIALKKLANEIGSPLFDRKHRFDYQLTPTGETLYSYATRLLSLRNEAVAALRDLAQRRGAVTAAAGARACCGLRIHAPRSARSDNLTKADKAPERNINQVAVPGSRTVRL